MAERDSVHQDCNDYVNKIEQDKLHDLYELIHSKEISPYMEDKMNDAFDQEIHRIYVNEEDHELMRDFLKGEDLDNDHPDR